MWFLQKGNEQEVIALGSSGIYAAKRGVEVVGNRGKDVQGHSMPDANEPRNSLVLTILISAI